MMKRRHLASRLFRRGLWHASANGQMADCVCRPCYHPTLKKRTNKALTWPVLFVPQTARYGVRLVAKGQ
eukprot:scaffold44595_cov39-Prasinocladus_malaysianus.AAC.1